MTHSDFCYWLQGFFEINGATAITSEQAKVIEQHLALVFTKVTNPNVTYVDMFAEIKRKMDERPQSAEPREPGPMEVVPKIPFRRDYWGCGGGSFC